MASNVDASDMNPYQLDTYKYEDNHDYGGEVNISLQEMEQLRAPQQHAEGISNLLRELKDGIKAQYGGCQDQDHGAERNHYLLG